jgi:hypothetical protein
MSSIGHTEHDESFAADTLVHRLEHLAWGEAPNEVRARCWHVVSTLVPRPNPQPPPLPAANKHLSAISGGRSHGSVDRHSFSRRACRGLVSPAQGWARRPTATLGATVR